jgi:hypothetical protein
LVLYKTDLALPEGRKQTGGGRRALGDHGENNAPTDALRPLPPKRMGCSRDVVEMGVSSGGGVLLLDPSMLVEQARTTEQQDRVQTRQSNL